MRLALTLLMSLLFAGALSGQDILNDLEKEVKSSDKKAAPAAASDASAPADATGGDQPASEQDSEAGSEPSAAEGERGEADDEPTDDDSAAEGSETSTGGVLGWLDQISKSGPLGMIREGGIFMWPILALGVLAAGVMIERYRSLKLLDSDSSQLRRDVQDLLHADQVEEAFHRCDNSQGPVPAVLACGLRKYLVLHNLNYDAARTEEQVIKAMEDHSVHIVAALERHLPILATISSVAPMLGFLGTVSGMITSFKDIEAMFEGSGGGQNIVQAAAGGISVALITTCFGLIIGIPAFMAYNYFTGIINRFVLEVEESTTDLIEGVTLQLAVTGAGAAVNGNRAPSAAATNSPSTAEAKS